MIPWIKQLRAVVANAITVTIADPFFLILHLSLLLLMLLLASIPGFTYGEHIKLLRDQCQALLFIVGCLAATFGLIRVITDDLRRGAGDVVRSRPVGPGCLLFGKWCGVFISVAILHSSGELSYLWVSEVAANAEFLNLGSLLLYLAAIGLALILGAIRHYLLGGSFVFTTNLLLIATVSAGWLVRFLLSGQGAFDWAGIQSGIMLGLALVVFSAVLLPIAVLTDSAVVLTLGVVVFFGGLVSEYVLNLVFSGGMPQALVRPLLPNWQNFWVADRLAQGVDVPLNYYASCILHAGLFVVLYLTVAVIFYDRSETRSI